jgi:predicted permease
MGIRAALGSGGVRLVRQLVTEELVLAAVSGGVTLAAAAWSQQLLAAFALPSPIPQRIDLSLDGTTIAFIAALIVLAGVLPGLAPAWQAAKVDLVSALSARGSNGGRPSRSRNALLAAQVIGSTVLLTGAALFMRSAAQVSGADPGFETTNALVIETEPALQGYDAARTRLLVDRLADRLRAMPGVIDVATADRIPFYVGFPRMTPLSLARGRCAAAPCPAVATYAVGEGFFRTMGIPLVSGRELDRTSAQTGVVVSESLAAIWWPQRSAVGEVVYLGTKGEPSIVIGVARETRHRNPIENTATPALYVPLADEDFGRAITLVARTNRAPGPLVLAATEAMHQVDPAVPAQSVKTMAERLEWTLWPTRTAMGFFAVCGGVALLLAAIGLFATVVHSVHQRTREFGVRLAIGSTRGRLIRDVLTHGARLIVPGTMIGLLLAAAGARSMSRVFAGVDVSDPLPYLAVAASQLLIALTACALPARRAASVDPMISLRAE